jgi:hypothetical protein
VGQSNHNQLVGDGIILKIENPDHSTEELPSREEDPETDRFNRLRILRLALLLAFALSEMMIKEENADQAAHPINNANDKHFR